MCFKNSEIRFGKWALDRLKDRKRIRQVAYDEKQSKRKQVADEKITLNEIVVQRKIMLKHRKQIKKWEEVKHKNDLLQLKISECNKWTIL